MKGENIRAAYCCKIVLSTLIRLFMELEKIFENFWQSVSQKRIRLTSEFVECSVVAWS